MIPLTNHDSQWGRSEVVIIYPGFHDKTEESGDFMVLWCVMVISGEENGDLMVTSWDRWWFYSDFMGCYAGE